MEGPAVGVVKAQATFDLLPDDILFKILKLLPVPTIFKTCAVVCKRWQRIVSDPNRWSLLNVVAPGAASFSDLKLAAYHKKTFQLLSVPVFSKIKILHLGNIKFSSHTLRKVFKSCPCVTTFNISNCSRLKTDYLQGLSGSITKLDISNNPQLSNRAMKYIVHCCPNLQELLIGGCTGLTDKGLAILGNSKLSLSVLNLRNNALLTGSGLMKLRHLTSLETLDLKGCTRVDSSGVASLVKHNLMLKTLILSTCVAVTDHVVSELCNRTKLKRLSLSKCFSLTSKSLLQLRNLHELEVLSLSRVIAVNDDVVAVLQQLPLRYLNLRGSLVGDEAIQSLSTMKSLETLSLQDCDLVQDVSPLAALPSLRHLNVSYCKNLTGESLQPIMERDIIKNINLRGTKVKPTQSWTSFSYHKVGFSTTVDFIPSKIRSGNSFDGKLLRERKQLKAGPSILKHFDQGAVLINWNLLAEGASLSEVCRNNEFNTKK